MKKFLALLILLVLAAGSFYWYTQSGVVLNEPAPEMMTKEEMKGDVISRQGSFTTIDVVHKATGLALIYPETATGPILRLQDFSATRGPDLYVYLSKNANITSADQLGEFTSLGQLKSSKGNQNYSLPSNHPDYKSVVIWCQAFGVLFSSATLEP